MTAMTATYKINIAFFTIKIFFCLWNVREIIINSFSYIEYTFSNIPWFSHFEEKFSNMPKSLFVIIQKLSLAIWATHNFSFKIISLYIPSRSLVKQPAIRWLLILCS